MSTETASSRGMPAWPQIIRQAGRLGLVGLLIAAGFLGGHWLAPHTDHAPDEAAAADRSPPGGDIVVISQAKRRAAGIETAKAIRRKLRATATVPGTLGYDQLRHVEIKTPVASVIETVYVKPGDMVKKGQPLALLSSADVALARNESKRLEAECELAETTFAWRRQTHDNLESLLQAIERRESLKKIEKSLSARPIGKRREPLLTAYSEYLLAKTVVGNSGSLEAQGVLSGRVYQERVSQLQRATAKLESLVEGYRFEARQELAEARARFKVAQREVAAQQERLTILLGAFGRDAPDNGLAHFVIHSPQGGRIEQLQAVRSLRLNQGDLLCVVADPSRLWLSAQIHQRHWSAVRIDPGVSLPFRLPAFPGESFTARVSFVGAQVRPGSHALPLVAVVDNSAGRLRPGMFAWVDVPLSDPVECVAVPTSAIQRHEGEVFVFVAEGPTRFRRTTVTLGLQTGDWTAVTEGLAAGSIVVSHGAFFLKSELLLEREPE